MRRWEGSLKSFNRISILFAIWNFIPQPSTVKTWNFFALKPLIHLRWRKIHEWMRKKLSIKSEKEKNEHKNHQLSQRGALFISNWTQLAHNLSSFFIHSCDVRRRKKSHVFRFPQSSQLPLPVFSPTTINKKHVTDKRVVLGKELPEKRKRKLKFCKDWKNYELKSVSNPCCKTSSANFSLPFTKTTKYPQNHHFLRGTSKQEFNTIWLRIHTTPSTSSSN